VIDILRNKEFRMLLLLMSFIILAGVILAFFADPLAGVLVMAVSLSLGVLTVFYTGKRYKDIKELSGYLRRIAGGDYSLDIRDNAEGELSILKNDIYKVTLILSKQAELLKTEKEQLADALSDISHQLKTPLTSMLVMSELLSKSDLETAKRAEFTKNLKLQLERMEWLLTSLLKLSKLDAGTVEFKKEAISAAALVNQAVKPLLIPMELKEQKLIIEGEATVSFRGDFNWTSEAILNILKNCMEHTGIGGTVTVTYSENPLYTEFLITDNGSGISKEDLPFIFKRFYRGKNAGDESVGIGLAMAKSIVMGQNGDISVTSHLNEGTRFSIKFYKQVT
jgi:signal transduction histidine kinase